MGRIVWFDPPCLRRGFGGSATPVVLVGGIVMTGVLGLGVMIGKRLKQKELEG